MTDRFLALRSSLPRRAQLHLAALALTCASACSPAVRLDNSTVALAPEVPEMIVLRTPSDFREFATYIKVSADADFSRLEWNQIRGSNIGYTIDGCGVPPAGDFSGPVFVDDVPLRDYLRNPDETKLARVSMFVPAPPRVGRMGRDGHVTTEVLTGNFCIQIEGYTSNGRSVRSNRIVLPPLGGDN